MPGRQDLTLTHGPFVATCGLGWPGQKFEDRLWSFMAEQLSKVVKVTAEDLRKRYERLRRNARSDPKASISSRSATPPQAAGASSQAKPSDQRLLPVQFKSNR